MSALENATLRKLGDTDQTVADPHEDIRRRKVTDVNGEEIGKVEDLLVDDVEGKVRFFELSDGGFLGIGKTKTFIPVDAISRITEEEVIIGHRREDVAGAASTYDPDLIAIDNAYFENLYGFYGYAPFWAPGYIYPPVPPRETETRPRSAP